MSAVTPVVDQAVVRAEMRTAMAKYLAAKKTYADVHAEFRRAGYGVDADFMAKKDPRVKSAITDAAFYANEVQTCALYLAVAADIPVPVTPAAAGEWLDPSCAPEGAWPGVTR